MGHTSTQGDWPRDFKIDATGAFMLIAHQKSNDLRVFGIDKTTGRLAPSGKAVALSKPVNVAFAGTVLLSPEIADAVWDVSR